MTISIAQLIFAALMFLLGCITIVMTILKTSRDQRNDLKDGLHELDKKVSIVDSHTSGNVARFEKQDDRLDRMQTRVTSHEGKIEFLCAQTEKLERRMDTLQQ